MRADLKLKNNHWEIIKPKLLFGSCRISVNAVIQFTLLLIVFNFIDQQVVFFDLHLPSISLVSGAAFIAVYHLGVLGSLIVFVSSLFSWVFRDNSISQLFIWAFFPTINATLGVFLLRLVICLKNPFERNRSFQAFLIFSAIIPTLLTTTIGSLIVQLNTELLPGAPTSFLMWWLAGAIGCIISAPLLNLFPIKKIETSKLLLSILFLSMALLLSAIFVGWTGLINDELPLQYLIFPVLLFVLFKRGLNVTCLLLLCGLVATLWGTTQGYGPFVRNTISQTSLLLQAFFGLSGVTILMLNAALNERNQAEEAMRKVQNTLERRVEDRTADLQDAQTEAEEANKTKSRFLSAVSHDLRQPIHALSLFIMSLKGRLEQEENQKVVSRIEMILDNLSSMLDGLLDMSRLENHAITPHEENFTIQSLFNDVITEHDRSAAQAKGLKLNIVPSSNVIRSDRTLLARVLGNFISNAIRYTDKGAICIGCRRKGETFHLEVWDTGRGLNQNEISQIFNPHTRITKEGQSNAEGLGLGLAIADGISKLLNHQIILRSTPNKGSCFSIVVPLGEASNIKDKSTITPAPSYNMPFIDKNILVIDDDDTVREAMNVLLGDWGCQVTLAKNKQDALNYANLLGNNLDLILSDFHLSDQNNGLEIIQEIQDMINIKVPAIIISGDTRTSLKHDIEKTDYHLLTKPIQPVSLRPLLRVLLK